MVGFLLLCPKLLYKMYPYPVKMGSLNEKYIFPFSTSEPVAVGYSYVVCAQAIARAVRKET